MPVNESSERHALTSGPSVQVSIAGNSGTARSPPFVLHAGSFGASASSSTPPSLSSMSRDRLIFPLDVTDPAHNAASGPDPFGAPSSEHHNAATGSMHTSGSHNTTTAEDEAGARALLRNQACLSCRRRKMRCDAVRPVCGTCARSREKSRRHKQPSPVPPGDCFYEEPRRLEHRPSKRKKVDGKERAPSAGVRNGKDKIEVPDARNGVLSSGASTLEIRVQQLEQLLALHSQSPNGGITAAFTPTQSTPPSTSSSHDRNGTRSPEAAVPIMQHLPSSSPPRRPRLTYVTRPIPDLPHEDIGNSASRQSPSIHGVFDAYYATANSGVSPPNVADPDPLLELLWPGWPPDLPSPDTVLHLSEIFFAKSPLRSLIYKPAFLTGLSLPPNHPQRPHATLVHAILAIAAPLSPYFEGTRPSVSHECASTQFFDDREGEVLAGQGKNLTESRAMSFADFHLSRSQLKLERALLRESRSPMDWMQAHVIQCYILASNSRLLESFFCAAKLARLLSPTGMTRMGSRQDTRRLRVSAVIPNATSAPEEHERRMGAWWTYITDVFNGGPGRVWEPVLDDAGFTTNLPPRLIDVLAGRDVPPSTQTLTSPNLFRAGHVDSFTLLIKAAAIQKRVRLLVSRSYIEHDRFEKPQGFAELDVNLMEFIASFPPEMQGSTGQEVDVLRLVAWCTLQQSVVNLHEYFIDKTDMTAESYSRTTMAVRSTVAAVQQLCASSFDFRLLHYQLFLCWTVTARMICKEIERQRAAGGQVDDEPVEALDSIISALHRAAEFSPCAARCYTLLLQFRTDKWNEATLGAYIDGLAAVEDDTCPPSCATGQSSCGNCQSSC